MDAKVSTSISVFGRTAASVLAGGVGSAIGVFVAYPIDVLKTKAQIKACNNNTNSSSSNNNKTIKNDSVFEIVRNIYKIEGIGGFFNGVLTTMIGNALVSAVSFSANELAISVLNATSLFGGSPDSRAVTPFIILLLAACFSGFVQTFVVIPVERVKVMMQAQENNSLYANELDCIKAVLKSEGWIGLLTRGLDVTLARDVPSYVLYFVVYGLLMQTTMKESIGMWASMVAGAAAGMACWIPIYPIDVVKTRMQNTKGGKADASGGLSVSAISVAIVMYRTEGIGSFFNGLGILLLRAAISNGVTFWIYDLIMNMLGYL